MYRELSASSVPGFKWHVGLGQFVSVSASCRSVRGVCKARVNDVNKCSSKRIKRPPESGDFRGCRMSFTLVESLVVIRFLTSSRHVTVRHGRKNRSSKAFPFTPTQKLIRCLACFDGFRSALLWHYEPFDTRCGIVKITSMKLFLNQVNC